MWARACCGCRVEVGVAAGVMVATTLSWAIAAIFDISIQSLFR